jgi:hypothetical protein
MANEDHQRPGLLIDARVAESLCRGENHGGEKRIQGAGKGA